MNTIASSKVHAIEDEAHCGTALQPHAYLNPDLLVDELRAFFYQQWQFVGHANDLPKAGDFLTFEIAGNSVIVIRGEDLELRAFQNVCRHRASRLLSASGHCNKVIQCPYHGWAYNLDGGLRGMPSMSSFPGLDKSEHGLNPVGLELLLGFIFIKIIDEPSLGVAESFGDSIRHLQAYDLESYRKSAVSIDQIWNCNWKIAWDNYQENYHIPVGHPGLNRMLEAPDEEEAFSSGISYSIFPLRDQLSEVTEEARYQELAKHSDHRVPERYRRRWVQFGFPHNLGLDFYPEMLDVFQLIPLSVDKTLVRAHFYSPNDLSDDEKQLIDANIQINTLVNDEDRTLCERVQRGLQSEGYRPGPLSLLESAVAQFHDEVRARIPGAR